MYNIFGSNTYGQNTVNWFYFFMAVPEYQRYQAMDEEVTSVKHTAMKMKSSMTEVEESWVVEEIN